MFFEIKPYHLGEETLDTAIVGVERNRRGLIENFAMAVLKDEKLFVIGKVTYGMDVATRSRLKENLVRDRGWLNSSSLPEWIHEESTQLSNITDYVAKENIQIVEVKASGVMNGILQFPVMKFLRDDKGVDEVDKYEDFVDFDKNLRTGSLINVGRSNETSSKKVNAAEVMEPYRVMGDNPVDEVGVELRGWQICVLRGNVDTSVQKLREIIHAFGGTPTANPGPSTKLVISGESNHLKTRSVVHSKKYNVVKADWLVKCEEQKQVIPITDEYVIYSCDSEIFNYFKSRSDDFLSMED
ncbi:hypothetical protein AB6A40_010795 [Gnathostoma spinigerum]|uniref:BRCT domain-containing protein n=1 Tax=Gnathostoma spinigerum TaxID=75299 RepID=A0ABD6F1U5_9BILA